MLDGKGLSRMSQAGDVFRHWSPHRPSARSRTGTKQHRGRDAEHQRNVAVTWNNSSAFPPMRPIVFPLPARATPTTSVANMSARHDGLNQTKEDVTEDREPAEAPGSVAPNTAPATTAMRIAVVGDHFFTGHPPELFAQDVEERRSRRMDEADRVFGPPADHAVAQFQIL